MWNSAPFKVFCTYYKGTDKIVFWAFISKIKLYMNIKKCTSAVIALTTLVTLTVAIPALASTTAPGRGAWGGHVGQGMHRGNKKNTKPGVFGTVSSISGNIITVTGKQGFGTNDAITTITFTVDATNAKIVKNNATGTISSIVVGDTIMAQGTLTGTNLEATTIRDGAIRGPNNGQLNPSAIVGNGQPVVAGVVSTISGSSITITNKSNMTYTVDVTNAKIMQNNVAGTISNIAVGDTIVAQGTVNGDLVSAAMIFVQAAPTNPAVTASSAQPHKGFFGAIGSFFSHIFGF
jgi:hypothetical protein